MNYVLLIMMHVGALGDGNSNALTSIVGFKNKAACEVAATKARQLAQGTTKEIRTVCVEII
jgi:Tfp pilus assembly ATPase PilU